MNIPSGDIATILIRHLKQEITPKEQRLLEEWIAANTHNAQIFERLNNADQFAAALDSLHTINKNKHTAWQHLRNALHLPATITPTAHRIHFLKTAWFRYAAAAILLLGIGGYLLWSDRGEIPAKGGNDKGEIVKSETFSNKPILTLASGKKIELNNKTPLLVKEGPVFDPREAGQKPGVASYNTITTPKGSQYQLILPDGTKAWLNAASSIKFPTTFTGKERRIEATGEVYLEVAINKKAPFIVSSREMEVQVLGTSFNINAYDDDPFKTSLVTGSVKVNDKLLTSGQAWLNGKIIKTDLDQDIAWKNGLFNFNNLSLKTTMNQLARWYDVEIVYQGQLPPFNFYGEMDRDLSLQQVLNGLSGLEGMEFKLTGRKLIVSAK